MARRQIPVHESVLRPRSSGILEAIAERLGVDEPPPETPERAPVSAVSDNHAEFVSEPPAVDVEVEPQDATEISEDSGQSIDMTGRQESILSFRNPGDDASLSIVDPRIVAAKGRQALYVRLPVQMHEYLDDLSHSLSKVDRSASMTNLVAQAILEKYPDAMGPREE